MRGPGSCSVAFGEASWESSNFLGFSCANGDVIDDVYTRDISEDCGIGTKKSDWTCAKDGGGLACAKVKASPGCGPDIADHEVVQALLEGSVELK